MTLGELAVRFGCELRGDPNVLVTHVASLQDAGPDAVCFVANPKYRQFLATTRAAAVIVDAATAQQCDVPVLISKKPYPTFAHVAALLHPPTPVNAGVHPSAVVDPSAHIDPSAAIGPLVVVGSGARIGARVAIGAGCIIQDNVVIGADTRLVARVTLCSRVQLGERCIVHPGAVIGADGFGYAPDGGTWIKVAQVGAVRVGNDVEIGANTTVDRGAIGDTVLEDGVKLDNQIQIGHNVRVGAHTAMAAGVGVAGSAIIGKHCMIGGKAGINGQIEICDGVLIGGHTTVGGSIKQPGSYSGAIGMEETKSFRRNAARFRQLDTMAKQVQILVKHTGAPPVDTTGKRRDTQDEKENQ
ncbi:MAG TPA: UDP-3-O-(3-hydroxymyristoyl)glucosamine N-acyltransferase [Steroidobacteraceae bacterium]|nr:UDP-3-O-(3-hydroxymyristoyl)glucosamine N-acyltransferase [Steroidobacteraceae bacterium]